MRLGGALLVAFIGCSTSPPAGTLVASVGEAWALVVDDDSAWVASSKGLVRVSLDGGGASVAAPNPDIQFETGDQDAIYVSTWFGSILRVPKDGGPAQELATSTANGPAIAVDDTYLYWMDQNGLARVPKTGGPTEPLTATQSGANELAVDDANLYWASTYLVDGGPLVDDTVSRAPKDGGGAVEILTADALAYTPLAIDDAGIYWSGSLATNGSIVRFDKATRQVSTVSTGQHASTMEAIAVDATRAYWTSWGIYYAPLDGGTATLLARTSDSTPAMTVRHGVVFWLDHDYDGGVDNLRSIPTP